jgi:hypothetical protein
LADYKQEMIYCFFGKRGEHVGTRPMDVRS